MILDPEHAARFERAIERRERLGRVPLFQPIVQVAKGQDDIRGASGRDVGLADAERGRDDLAVGRRVRADLLVENRVVLFRLGGRGLARLPALERGVIDPVVVQERREDLRPVPAPGPDLDDRRLRPDAEEGEFLQRMARAVAGDEFRAALRIVDRRVERQVGGGGGRRGEAERKSEDERDGHAHAEVSRSRRLVRHGRSVGCRGFNGKAVNRAESDVPIAKGSPDARGLSGFRNAMR